VAALPTGQALLGPLDLCVLALGARLLPLVVCGEQQDDLLTVRVAEDAQQDVAVCIVQIDRQDPLIGNLWL